MLWHRNLNFLVGMPHDISEYQPHPSNILLLIQLPPNGPRKLQTRVPVTPEGGTNGVSRAFSLAHSRCVAMWGS